MKVIEALKELEVSAKIDPPKGAIGLPPRVRYQEILSRLRREICPSIKPKINLLESEKASLVALITDIILSSIGNLAIPAATIARSILIVGIKEFCDDPSSIVNKEEESQ